jgi:hypothetical protein
MGGLPSTTFGFFSNDVPIHDVIGTFFYSLEKSITLIL